MTPIRCGAMNHVNAVIDDFEQTVDLFTEVYGAQFLIDMPREEWHACLIAIGRVIFQVFSPHDTLLHARFGPHYVGIEYTVPNVDEARDATNARGIRIAASSDLRSTFIPLTPMAFRSSSTIKASMRYRPRSRTSNQFIRSNFGGTTIRWA